MRTLALVVLVLASCGGTVSPRHGEGRLRPEELSRIDPLIRPGDHPQLHPVLMLSPATPTEQFPSEGQSRAVVLPGPSVHVGLRVTSGPILVVIDRLRDPPVCEVWIQFQGPTNDRSFWPVIGVWGRGQPLLLDGFQVVLPEEIVWFKLSGVSPHAVRT
jgi:hypothetical protein